jgi:hypothetical protein
MITDRFEVPARLKATGMVLTVIGLLTVIVGAIVFLKGGAAEHEHARFWTVLLHNSVFFLMITVASVFIQAAAALAQGSWIVAYKRVPEAIGANVWVFGVIALIVLFAIVFGLGDHNPIYHWVNPHGDKILEGKSAFLNKGMFAGFTIVTIGLWSYFGHKFRAMSLAQQKAPVNSTKIYWKVVTLGGVFLLVYGLTMMSTTPWYWIMSIDAHWYSTLFSWYVFASSFVSGMALILLWTVYLKNRGSLFIVTKEHMHDLGKFMFAFSIFWTYTWFAQYMLIWYGNVPEETTYYKTRQQGPYGIVFYTSLILNFVLPILVLMTAPSKRNYFTVVFMAVAIIFGHWLDFYQMIMPSPLGAHWHISWYELGIFAGFAGVMILAVSRTLAKEDLIPQNNPMLKEAIVHLS